jgi:hypothetical protein
MQRWMPALALVAVALVGAGVARAGDGLCPPQHRSRTPEQVLEDHRAMLAAGDVDRDVQCNYARDAVVVSDQGVDVGRDAIRLSLLGLVQFFGGAVPAIHSEVVVTVMNDRTHMAKVLFSVVTPCIAVPDGIDTYVIKNGQIHAQSAHGFPVFTCGPPPF